MTLSGKIISLLSHPSIIKHILSGKSSDELRKYVRNLEDISCEKNNYKQIKKFISDSKKNWRAKYGSSDTVKRNGLCSICNIDDWERPEIKEILYELRSRKAEVEPDLTWEYTISSTRRGLIHRKDWEWALGILAMQRFGKLQNESLALGIGAGKETVLFYLANKLRRVYATDLYSGESDWKIFAPSDFPENPAKYAPFQYKEEALKIFKMDGTNLDFPNNTFDIAFSFSSIEHFGGERHVGAIKCLKEIERVLKPGGIATIATEYIVNGQPHNEYFNIESIYSDLISSVKKLVLVEPIDFRISPRTLDTVMDVKEAVAWDTNRLTHEYKILHPYVLLRAGNTLLTSIMLVFQKKL